VTGGNGSRVLIRAPATLDRSERRVPVHQLIEMRAGKQLLSASGNLDIERILPKHRKCRIMI
jgi:hypothetical protein